MLIFFETDPADAPIRTQLPTLGLLKNLHVGRLLSVEFLVLVVLCLIAFLMLLVKILHKRDN